ncbi:MAG: hypothetical protein IKL54_00225 [Bacteroidaceae bacterium]|nr:hypothetical protein [Bacteroidaceae bacterium]
MNMKKEYFAPAAVYMTVECDTIIATSPVSISIDKTQEGNEQLSNKQQGTWGNVWNK